MHIARWDECITPQLHKSLTRCWVGSWIYVHVLFTWGNTLKICLHFKYTDTLKTLVIVPCTFSNSDECILLYKLQCVLCSLHTIWTCCLYVNKNQILQIDKPNNTSKMFLDARVKIIQCIYINQICTNFLDL